MARLLIRSKEEVLANFQVLIDLRQSADPALVQKYRGYLKSAKVLVVAQVKGKREYAPSRFVGYRANTLAKHTKGHEAGENDGTVTNAKLAELFGKIYYADPEEDEKFIRFCEQHRITKELDGLTTPLKYIFADFGPSPSAVLRKAKGSNIDNESLNVAAPATSCYLVGASWEGAKPENQLLRFLKDGIWENGHDKKFTGIVKEIPVGATLFVKAFYFHQGLKKQVLDIKARGEVTSNTRDGNTLSVAWVPNFESYRLTAEELPGFGGLYWDTVTKVTEPNHLAYLLNGTKPNILVKTAPAFPRNQILYGPPGTGKTYHTTARAVALLEGVSDEALLLQYPPEKRADLRQKFEDYRAAGRIAFVTFHQAFTYEDFVEGIKPLPPTPTSNEVGDVNATTATTAVQYDVLPGIFRRICERAATASNTATAPPVPAFNDLYDGFLAQLRHRMSETKGPLTFSSKTGEPMVLTDVPKSKPGRLTFLHGNSGQIDHHVDKSWIQKLYNQYHSIDQIHKLKNDITDTVGGSNATLLWVVFNELKKYEAEWLAQAREQERLKQQDTTAPPFVLIIDEINRGNVANIFGELITLLEDDKRAGRAEAATVQLTYSQKPFSVPDNLYLLGTMNTADRSVEALDTALRRRFSFTEMLPRPELLSADVEGINVEKLLRAINSRLEQLLDHDHCLGHALLMGATNLAKLREAFQNNIVPLLKEYFFGDWGKIGLVLGDAFIQQVNKKMGADGFKLMAFGSYHVGEMSEKPVYRLVDIEQVGVQAFQKIYAL